MRKKLQSVLICFKNIFKSATILTDMDKDNNSKSMRVHESFDKLILDYIKRFKDKNGIKISTTQATNILAQKIDDLGGITLD